MNTFLAVLINTQMILDGKTSTGMPTSEDYKDYSPVSAMTMTFECATFKILINAFLTIFDLVLSLVFDLKIYYSVQRVHLCLQLHLRCKSGEIPTSSLLRCSRT